MYYPDRGCVLILRTLYVYVTASDLLSEPSQFQLEGNDPDDTTSYRGGPDSRHQRPAESVGGQ